MRASVMARLQLETDLIGAVERSEFRNYYQPIVSLDSGRIVGFEALLRWQHPTRGLLGPEAFIPVAEETGMIRELGWWNLRESCRQIRDWRALPPAYRDITVSVNLSAKQFLQPNLVVEIGKLLEELKVPPQALKLEITESTVMGDPATAAEMLQQIKALGSAWPSTTSAQATLRLATYIDSRSTPSKSIAPSQRHMEGGEGMEIVRTIMPMASNLRLNVIAEGVETIEQVAMLRKLHCKYAQGFYFSQPLEPTQAAALVAEEQAWQLQEQAK